MPASTRRRITAKELREDIDAFYAKYEGQPWYNKALVQKLTKK